MLLPSPEFGTETTARKTGRIDFFFPAFKWGFELLRDGDRLKGHAKRFDEDGAYGAWIKSTGTKDYLILDFRTNKPDCAHPGMYIYPNNLSLYVTLMLMYRYLQA